MRGEGRDVGEVRARESDLVSWRGGSPRNNGFSFYVCFTLYLNIHTCVTQKLGLAACLETNWVLIQSGGFIFVVWEELKLPIFDSLTR